MYTKDPFFAVKE